MPRMRKNASRDFDRILLLVSAPVAASSPPNILWLWSDDHGPHLGCYGDTCAMTPNVDRLAAKGPV